MNHCHGSGSYSLPYACRSARRPSLPQWSVGELRHEKPFVTSHDAGASRHGFHWLDLADELSFIGISGQQNTGHTEVLERLQHRIVHGAAGTAGSSGHDDMQSHIAGLSQ